MMRQCNMQMLYLMYVKTKKYYDVDSKGNDKIRIFWISKIIKKSFEKIEDSMHFSDEYKRKLVSKCNFFQNVISNNVCICMLKYVAFVIFFNRFQLSDKKKGKKT